jgi:Uncharacterized protein family UPF0016
LWGKRPRTVVKRPRADNRPRGGRDTLRSELAALPFGYLFLVFYWTVFIAELVGDKSIYTVSSLTLRFRPLVVFMGAFVAFAVKMLAAVLLGRFVVNLNYRWTDLVSACAFFVSAMLIWFATGCHSSLVARGHDFLWLAVLHGVGRSRADFRGRSPP